MLVSAFCDGVSSWRATLTSAAVSLRRLSDHRHRRIGELCAVLSGLIVSGGNLWVTRRSCVITYSFGLRLR